MQFFRPHPDLLNQNAWGGALQTGCVCVCVCVCGGALQTGCVQSLVPTNGVCVCVCVVEPYKRGVCVCVCVCLFMPPLPVPCM